MVITVNPVSPSAGLLLAASPLAQRPGIAGASGHPVLLAGAWAPRGQREAGEDQGRLTRQQREGFDELIQLSQRAEATP